MAWVIEQYKLKSPQWKNATASTRDVYDRRHHWLAKNYGIEQLADFDRDMLKQMRDLPEFARKIAAVLGHSTMKQVAIYVAQAQQRLLARGAQDMRDAMYERERLDAMIDMAGNVTKLRA